VLDTLGTLMVLSLFGASWVAFPRP